MSVKTLAKKNFSSEDLLAEGENPFSTNKVTGHSLNYPIIGTCTPSEVCAETCYFAKGPSTWSASLAKQHRLLNSTRHDPVHTGRVISRWATRLRLTFIRWCGGGDLVQETTRCLDIVATSLPHIPQWVVTRKPEIAALVTPRDNVYLHLSVDKSSWSRLHHFDEIAPHGLQWFWSYQCDKGERPASGDVAPVIFRHAYDLDGAAPFASDCPLNTHDSIVGVCEQCRRCFNGDAVASCTART